MHALNGGVSSVTFTSYLRLQKIRSHSGEPITRDRETKLHAGIPRRKIKDHEVLGEGRSQRVVGGSAR